MKRNKFEASLAVEKRYAQALRKIARAVAALISSKTNGATIGDVPGLLKMMDDYSRALEPWAMRVSEELITSTARLNARAWASSPIGARFKSDLLAGGVGAVARQLQMQQVQLIKSIPIEAGLRAQKLAMEAATGGRRADEVAEELMRTEEVTSSRATLIARTEISKANAEITRARAEYVGATSYIWKTAGDGDVRESHAEMDGEVIRYDQPPTLSDGMTGHAGEFPNCRCFQVPVLNNYE